MVIYSVKNQWIEINAPQGNNNNVVIILHITLFDVKVPYLVVTIMFTTNSQTTVSCKIV